MTNEIQDFDFKKKFGQNFLRDKNLLLALVNDANVLPSDEVLEIGVGGGALTEVLVKKTKKVIGFEIDKSLENYLQEKFSADNNIEIIFKDILRMKTNEIDKLFDKEYRIVANIPYYITSPIIFKFMEESEKCVSQALMVQKEVAKRICAKPKDEDYGALSVVCQHFCNCKILRVISKKLFKPMPKVDSAFILLEKKLNFDVDYSTLVKNSFSMRRKTLINNLIKAYDLVREDFENIFKILNFDVRLRAEDLSHKDYEALLSQIKTNLCK